MGHIQKSGIFISQLTLWKQLAVGQTQKPFILAAFEVHYAIKETHVGLACCNGKTAVNLTTTRADVLIVTNCLKICVGVSSSGCQRGITDSGFRRNELPWRWQPRRKRESISSIDLFLETESEE